MHGIEAAVLLAPLEEREVGHPQKVVAAVRYQSVFTAEVEPERAEGREDDVLGATDREHEIFFPGTGAIEET